MIYHLCITYPILSNKTHLSGIIYNGPNRRNLYFSVVPASQSQGRLTGYLCTSLESANRFCMKKNPGKSRHKYFSLKTFSPTFFSACSYHTVIGCSGCRGHKQLFFFKLSSVGFMRTDWFKGIWLFTLLSKYIKHNKMVDEFLCSSMQSGTFGKKTPTL